MDETSVLDNRRTPCAVGLIRADEVAAGLPAGSRLEILTKDRFAPIEIPLWASRSGHSAPEMRKAGRWPFGYMVFSLVVSATKGQVAGPA
ncbi:MAG: sulfurtransferase TusA family protein [Microbacteriaceae bacterium]|nr:sulfurtransferase TusA family protein [Microbacteriaceae bacterium]